MCNRTTPFAVAGFLLGSVLLSQDVLLAATPVSFRQQVAPLLLDNCVACHGAKSAEGGYRVDAYAEMFKPGDSGELPVGQSKDEAGELLRRLTTSDEHERMPAESEPLTQEQIQTIADWIAAGAKFDGTDPNQLLPLVIPPPRHPDPPAHYNVAVPITAVAFSPDGSQVLSAGYHELTIWNLADATLARRIRNVGQRVYAMAFSPDGTTLAVACGEPGRSGEVRVIDFESGDVRTVLARSADVALDVAFRPGANQLAVASADKLIRIVDLDSLEVIHELASHADWVTAVAWSDDGKRLVSASRDSSAKVFDAQSGQLLVSYQGHDAAVRGVRFLPDGQQILSTGGDGKLHRWAANTGKRIAAVSVGGDAYKIVSGGDSAWLPCADQRLRKVDLAKTTVAGQFDGFQDQVLSAAWHAPSGRMAAGAFDGEIRVWDIGDGKMVQSWSAQP